MVATLVEIMVVFIVVVFVLWLLEVVAAKVGLDGFWITILRAFIGVIVLVWLIYAVGGLFSGGVGSSFPS